MKITTILGTRPEIIKLSPLLPLLDTEFDHFIIHTGQHYDFEMDELFFKELKLNKPKYNLKVGSARQGKQTSVMLEKIEEILLNEKPDGVIVLGDTNTVLAGALAASKLHIKVIHIESGCRSYNKKMPEEINRVLTDHISDILFAPDKTGFDCLIKEGIPKEKVHLVGSTIFDACVRNKEYSKNSKIITKLNLTRDKFILVTLHRAGNTNDVDRLKNIIKALNIISSDIEIVFPAHPRTMKIINQNNIQIDRKIKIIKPVGYIDFLALMDNCRIIISDSGGIQEEAIVFNKPCLIPRKDSEWMRLVEAGKNFLIDDKTDFIVEKVRKFLTNDSKLNEVKAIDCPYETGVAEKIIEILKK